MSLMESMRSGTDSTFAQVVLILVIFTFIFWGVRNDGDTQQSVATVNGEVISSTEFSEVLRLRERELEAKTNGPVPEDARARLREEVRQDLIRQHVVLQEARRLGLEVSDAEVANALLDVKGFQDKDGNFDMTSYETFLRGRGKTRGNFEEELREQLLHSKLATLLSVGVSVPESVIKSRFLEQNTRVNLEYVRVRPTAFASTFAPTAEETDAWVKENGSLIEARYQQDFEAVYNQKEKVKVSLIRLAIKDDGLAAADLKPRLDKVKAELAGGADFATLAQTWSEDPSAAKGGDAGEIPVAQLDPAVASALAALEVGGLSEVIVGVRDLRLYRLDARIPARVVPLDEAKVELGPKLMKEVEGPKRAATFVEQTLLPQWVSAGTPPADALSAQGLSVTTTGLIAAGGSQMPSLFQPPAEMLTAARAAQPGTVLSKSFAGPDGTLWVGKLIEREDADLAKYEGEKEIVREQALIEARGDFFEAWVADVTARATISQ